MVTYGATQLPIAAWFEMKTRLDSALSRLATFVIDFLRETVSINSLQRDNAKIKQY